MDAPIEPIPPRIPILPAVSQERDQAGGERRRRSAREEPRADEDPTPKKDRAIGPPEDGEAGRRIDVDA